MDSVKVVFDFLKTHAESGDLTVDVLGSAIVFLVSEADDDSGVVDGVRELVSVIARSDRLPVSEAFEMVKKCVLFLKDFD